MVYTGIFNTKIKTVKPTGISNPYNENQVYVVGEVERKPLWDWIALLKITKQNAVGT